jgi:DNA-binding transcriptional MerR regulator
VKKITERKCTVGILARLAGVSSDSIRHYERIGILPRAERASSGYRLWDSKAVDYLKWIGPAKQAGFTLRELADIFQTYRSGSAPCRNVRDLLQQKLNDLDKEISDLSIKHRKLKNVLSRWDARLRQVKPGEFVPLLEDLPTLRPLQVGKNHKKFSKKMKGGHR